MATLSEIERVVDEGDHVRFYTGGYMTCVFTANDPDFKYLKLLTYIFGRTSRVELHLIV